MDLSAIFKIEMDITVKMEGDDIFNLPTISSLSSQVRGKITNYLNTFESDVIDITGSDNINEKTETLLSNIYGDISNNIEENEKAEVFKTLSRFIFNRTKESDDIKISADIAQNFDIPVSVNNQDAPITMARVNSVVVIKTDDTISVAYSPIQIDETITLNYDELDLQVSVIAIDPLQNSAGNNYAITIKNLSCINDPKNINDTSKCIVLKTVNTETLDEKEDDTLIEKVPHPDDSKITEITFTFKSCTCDISVLNNLTPPKCIIHKSISSSLALNYKKSMVVSKQVGQSGSISCLLKAGGPGDLWQSKHKSKYGVDKKHGSYDRYLARKVGNVFRKETIPDRLSDRRKYVTNRIPDCSGCGVDQTPCRGCYGYNSQSVPKTNCKKKCILLK